MTRRPRNSQASSDKPLPDSPYRSPKVKWSKEEDELLLRTVRSFGQLRWVEIASKIPGRNSKQCRERWLSNLNPEIDLSPWTPEEEDYIMELHKKFGNKWARIAKHFKGRTSISIKNHFRSLSRKVPQKIATPPVEKPVAPCDVSDAQVTFPCDALTLYTFDNDVFLDNSYPNDFIDVEERFLFLDC